MSTSYYADRVNLYHLHHRHPEWSQQQLADALGRSREPGSRNGWLASAKPKPRVSR